MEVGDGRIPGRKDSNEKPWGLNKPAEAEEHGGNQRGHSRGCVWEVRPEEDRSWVTGSLASLYRIQFLF